MEAGVLFHRFFTLLYRSKNPQGGFIVYRNKIFHYIEEKKI
ncbi:ACD_00240 [African swine fever virus]